MIWIVRLFGFVVGYLSVFVALAAIKMINIRINGVCESFKTKRTFIDTFLDVFCHPYIKFSLSGNRMFVFGIKHYKTGNNTGNGGNNKVKNNIHNSIISKTKGNVKE